MRFVVIWFIYKIYYLIKKTTGAPHFVYAGKSRSLHFQSLRNNRFLKTVKPILEIHLYTAGSWGFFGRDFDT